MRYGDGGQLEFVPAIDLVGLGHGIFEDLLVSLLAQDGPDVHDLRLAAGPRAGAREEHRQQKQTHRVAQQTAQRSPVAFLPGGGSARPASGQLSQLNARLQAQSRWAVIAREGGQKRKRKTLSKKRWFGYMQCGGMCMIMLETGCQPGTSNPHCPPSLLSFEELQNLLVAATKT